MGVMEGWTSGGSKMSPLGAKIPVAHSPHKGGPGQVTWGHNAPIISVRLK